MTTTVGAGRIQARTRMEKRVFRELLELGAYLDSAQHSAQAGLVNQYRQMIEERCVVLSGLRR